MKRTKSTLLALIVVLFSPMAANADLIRLDAVSAPNYLVSDFYIIFDDTGDGLLSWDEVIEFSGVIYNDSILYDILVATASISGISVKSIDPSASINWTSLDWLFQRSDTGSLATCGVADAACWNYSLSSVAVPEPGTLGLLGIGLAALGLTRRRRNI